MTSLTLYPSDRNSKLGVLYGIGSMAVGGYFVFSSGDLEFSIFGYVAMAMGVWSTGRAVLQIANPKPVFEADAAGFSVKGKAKRPWSEFRGVSVHNASRAMFSFSKMVRVKVGESFLGGSVQINQTQLSHPATTMVRLIEEFASAQKFGAAAMVEKYQVPPLESVELAHKATPIDEPSFTKRPAATRVQDMGAGPVQSPPTLSERVFGRRKVI